MTCCARRAPDHRERTTYARLHDFCAVRSPCTRAQPVHSRETRALARTGEGGQDAASATYAGDADPYVKPREDSDGELDAPEIEADEEGREAEAVETDK